MLLLSTNIIQNDKICYEKYSEDGDDQLIGFEDFCNVVASFLNLQNASPLVEQSIPDEGFNDLIQMVSNYTFSLSKTKNRP